MPKVNRIYLTALKLTAQNIPLKITEYALTVTEYSVGVTEYSNDVINAVKSAGTGSARGSGASEKNGLLKKQTRGNDGRKRRS